MTNRCAGFYVFTRRARVRPEPRLYSVNLKATGAPEVLKSALRRAPISLVTNARAWTLGRSDFRNG